MDIFEKITPFTYWLLVIVWAIILFLYFRYLKQEAQFSKPLHVLLIVLAIDAFRTFFESLYFGISYTSRSGMIPETIFEILFQPQNIFIPKFINLVAAFLVLVLLLKQLLPEIAKDKLIQGDQIRELHNEIEKRVMAENKFTNMIESMYDWAWEVDANGVYTFASPSVENILGYKARELIGKTPFDLMPEAEAKCILEQFLEIKNNNSSINGLINVNLHKDGHQVILETSGVPVFDRAGQLAGYQGIDRDVTARVQLEQQVEMERKRMEMFFDLHASIHVLAKTDGTILSVNNGWKVYLGYDKSDLVGTNLLNLVHPDDVNATLDEIKKLEQGMTTFSFKNRYISKQNGYRLLDWSAEFSDIDGLIYATANDVTDKQASLEQLETRVQQKTADYQVAIEKLELATRAADIGIWYWNLADDALEWDQRMYDIYHVPEAMRKTHLMYDFWRHTLHPDDIDRAELALQRAVDGDRTLNIIFRIILPNGDVRHIQSAATIGYDEAGKPASMVGINRDITEQKLLDEERRIAQEKAEQANLEKSRFLANMSHELRTPMHAVLSFTSLALKKVESDKQRRYLENIRSSGIRLTSLLDDLLDLAKLEAGKTPVEFKKQDLTVLVERMISEVESLLADKRLSVKFNGDEHFVCTFDQKLMAQVIMNLMSNAIKFSPEGGNIGILVESFNTLLNHRQQAVIQLSVKDQGIGIPDDQLEKVFGHFEQSSISSSGAGGTGLGLPITREILNLHHGKVWAESPPAHEAAGSVFFVQIPVEQEVEGPVSLS